MGNCTSESCRWRNPHPDLKDPKKWTPQSRTRLLHEMQREISTRASITPSLLFVGPISAGKSSLVNTFLSAGADDIVYKAFTGTSTSSLTLQYTRYCGVEQLKKKYRVCDTKGILHDEARSIRPKDLLYVIRGHVGQGYEFKDHVDISEDDPKFVSKPPDEMKSHCLVMVLASDKVTELSMDYQSQVKRAIAAARGEGIPVTIILTKIDKICKNVKEVNRRVFTCKHVKEVIDITSEMFGLPDGLIFPVINYHSQVIKTESDIDIIALLALKRLLKLAFDNVQGTEFD